MALDEPGYHYSLGGRLANFPALCVTVCVHITLLFTISLEFTIRVNYRDSLNNIDMVRYISIRCREDGTRQGSGAGGAAARAAVRAG